MSEEKTEINTGDDGDENIVGDTQGGNNRSTWPLNGEHVNRNTAHLPENARELLRWFFGFSTDRNDSMRAAAAKINVDSSTVFRVYKGTYKDADGNPIVPAKMLKGIKTLMREEEQRSGKERIDFVMTPTAKKIFTACDIARSSGRLVMLFGTSQTGKTTALREYQRRNNHGTTRYIRVSPYGSASGLLRQLARSCALSPDGNAQSLQEALARTLDRHNLLIADEVHLFTYTYAARAKLSCLEILRWLHDTTGCAMVLCGTNVWKNELISGREKEKLDQLTRRGATPVQLPDTPTAGDLRAICKSYSLEAPEKKSDAEEIMNYAAKTKGLTLVTELLRFGAKIAGQAGETLAWKHVLEANDTINDLATGEGDDAR